ncbi:hypothetical protein ACFOST_13355 [Cytobacillus kochii]|uniref:hypothetical protein n=1 Tax=Cytobacillus TaxID=2675230 RepID=UPI002781C3D4|nr:hypothetical protein [Cytobacillus kochii]MDQ0185670.1 hypothetical protein [Cytobacillus kochii]
MMEFIAVLFGVLGFFLIVNLFFSFLYLISRAAGGKFYSWIVHDFEFLMILSLPLFGLTEYVANEFYERFNGLVTRMLLLVYALLVFILAIICFILLFYFGDKV